MFPNPRSACVPFLLHNLSRNKLSFKTLSFLIVAQASRLCIFSVILHKEPGVILPSVDQFLF
jgi:hypothetical protein